MIVTRSCFCLLFVAAIVPAIAGTAVFTCCHPALSKDSSGAKQTTCTIEKQKSSAPQELKHVNTAGVHASIVINAPVEIVWLTVHEERQNAPDIAYSRIVRQSENEMQIEQKFKFWSGGATCLMNHKEVPNQRIDYELIKSDHLKELHGSWVLTPNASGNETTLELSTVMDIGFLIPRAVANAFITRVLERRLAHVKQMAEQHKEEMEVKGQVLSLGSGKTNHAAPVP